MSYKINMKVLWLLIESYIFTKTFKTYEDIIIEIYFSVTFKNLKFLELF